MTQPVIQLVYDKQCPACDHYTQLVRLRESVGELELVNAREDSALMTEITAAGIDIDAGMVVRMKGDLYHGADAMHVIALLGSRSGWFNRLNYALFRNRAVARLAYPVLRAGRNLLLKLRGQSGSKQMRLANKVTHGKTPISNTK